MLFTDYLVCFFFAFLPSPLFKTTKSDWTSWLTIMSSSSTALHFLSAGRQPGNAMDRLISTAREGKGPISNGQASGTGRRPSSAAEPKKNSTFSNQVLLPKLPIPDLEGSCKKYIEALYPLQSPSERQETRAAVEDFLGTEGPVLQEKLKEYASSQTSYIEQFCASHLFPAFHIEADCRIVFSIA